LLDSACSQIPKEVFYVARLITNHLRSAFRSVLLLWSHDFYEYAMEDAYSFSFQIYTS